MSVERAGKGYGWRWPLVFVAVVVAYVLSVPPLVYREFRRPGPAAGGNYEGPTWVQVYEIPYNWFSRIPGLKELLMRYDLWWYEKGKPK